MAQLNFDERMWALLKRMEIAPDSNGRLRLGDDISQQLKANNGLWRLGTEGGRWLSGSEYIQAKEAMRGLVDLPVETEQVFDPYAAFRLGGLSYHFGVLPETAKFRHAAATSTGLMKRRVSALERILEANGTPNDAMMAEYYKHNRERGEKGEPADTPQQYALREALRLGNFFREYKTRLTDRVGDTLMYIGSASHSKEALPTAFDAIKIYLINTGYDRLQLPQRVEQLRTNAVETADQRRFTWNIRDPEDLLPENILGKLSDRARIGR